jgi:hypothetical protein
MIVGVDNGACSGAAVAISSWDGALLGYTRLPSYKNGGHRGASAPCPILTIHEVYGVVLWSAYWAVHRYVLAVGCRLCQGVAKRNVG